MNSSIKDDSEFRVTVSLTQKTIHELFAGGNVSHYRERDPNPALSLALNVMDHVGQELKLLGSLPFGEMGEEGPEIEEIANRIWRLGMQLDAAQDVVSALLKATEQNVAKGGPAQ